MATHISLQMDFSVQPLNASLKGIIKSKSSFKTHQMEWHALLSHKDYSTDKRSYKYKNSYAGTGVLQASIVSNQKIKQI